MLSTPHIAEGVTVTPVVTADGTLKFRLSPRVRGAGSLVPPRTFIALVLMDGRRTLAHIHEQLTDLGIRMPDPGRLIDMVRLFEAAGVVTVEHRFVTPKGGLRHTCEGCGRSCEGHLVGPIEDDEALELEDRLADLRMRHADLPVGPATHHVEYEGESHRVLNFPEGVCIFLDPNRRCRLHSEWGPQAKPLPCRMFPFRVVRTETGTRVAISPRCFRAQNSYRTAPSEAPEALMRQWGVWRPPAQTQGLDPDKAASLRETPGFLSNLAREHQVLAALGQPGATLEDLLLHLLAEAEAAGHGGTSSSRRRRDRFGRAGLGLLQGLLRDHFAVSQAAPKSHFGRSVQRLIAGVRALDPNALDDWNDLPGPALAYVSHCLRHFVFSRDVMVFGSVRVGVVAAALGAMAARWLTPRSELEAGDLDGFAEHLISWIRVVSSPEVRGVLFATPASCDVLLRELQR